MAPPPELVDEAFREILLRSPPDEPACLVRASLVSKRWRRILSDPVFLRRYRSFHRTPPLLGFFHDVSTYGEGPRFVPTTAAASPSLRTPLDRGSWAFDCRHGRVLLHAMGSGKVDSFVVWDPITGDQVELPEPDIPYCLFSASVLCARDGCDHLHCDGGPFHVVFVGSDAQGLQEACIYSSEAGAWSAPASVRVSHSPVVQPNRGAIVGDKIYFRLTSVKEILKFDLGKHNLSLIDTPDACCTNGVLMGSEIGLLRLADIKGSRLYVWSKKVEPEEVAGWVQWRVIELETLIFTYGILYGSRVIGFSEDASAIFIRTNEDGVFIFELKSGKIRKVCKDVGYNAVLPFTSFYTPGWQCGAELKLAEPNPVERTWPHTTECAAHVSQLIPTQTIAGTGRDFAMPSPPLMDDLIGEILLHLPADEPEHFLRASLVCKPWLRIVSDPTFLRRYRAINRAPPLLALLYRRQVLDGDPDPRFVPTTLVPPFPHPGADGRRTRPLDCRHGRVLIHMVDDEEVDYLVWDPVTGDRHILPKPDIHWMAYTAAVFCATPGCDHLDCQGGPFRVAFVASDHSRDIIWASVYSSDTGEWSTPVPLINGDEWYVKARRGALVGDEVFFTVRKTDIVRYDWGMNRTSVIKPPPSVAYDAWVSLMEMEDGSLGLANVVGWSLNLWSRKVNSKQAAEWVLCKVIDLEELIPVAGPDDQVFVAGFAEGVNVIFLTSGVGLFSIELKSGQVKKVDEPGVYYSVLPYMSFYTPDRARLASITRIRGFTDL